MNRYQIIRRVQGLLRDDSYPKEVMNESLNRVLGDINGFGRFTFQEKTATISLSQGTYQYPIPTDLIAEELLVYQLGTTNQLVLTKVIDPFNAIANGLFINTGIPSAYIRFGSAFWFDPIPDGAAAGNGISVFYYRDIPMLTSDVDIPIIPDRWHGSLLVYGVAADLAPGIMVRSPEGNMFITQAYQRMLRNFQVQEGWDPYTDKRLIRDSRWEGFELAGNVSKVR